MGSSCSRAVGIEDKHTPVEYEASTGIDAKIMKALQKKKKQYADAGVSLHTFDKVILQFGMVRKAFLGMRETYDRFIDTEAGGLRYGDLKKVMEEIGVEMNEQDLKEIFYESDLRRDESLDFNEFVVSLAIGYVLDEIPDAPKDPTADPNKHRKSLKPNEKLKLDKAFNLIVDSYLMFDVDASGTINYEEMNGVMGGSAAGSSGFLNQERWKELDWDNDGTITFQEYLLAFESWVGIEPDDE